MLYAEVSSVVLLVILSYGLLPLFGQIGRLTLVLEDLLTNLDVLIDALRVKLPVASWALNSVHRN